MSFSSLEKSLAWHLFFCKWKTMLTPCLALLPKHDLESREKAFYHPFYIYALISNSQELYKHYSF